VFELHFRAVVEPEYREGFDTFWCKYGTEEWKVVKQGYFEYTAIAPIVVNCYEDGNTTAPAFSFTLLSTGGFRQIIWVRFPPTKAKMFRWIGTSTGGFTFQMYESSFIEAKPVCGAKGYTKAPLVM
jgi:hypothetical protein